SSRPTRRLVTRCTGKNPSASRPTSLPGSTARSAAGMLRAMGIEIVPIERRHAGGFREVLDGVARERRYIAFLEAPPLAEVRRFVLNGLRNGTPAFVAVDDGRVVGWCDVTRRLRPTTAHSGVLGMGVAASHR